MDWNTIKNSFKTLSEKTTFDLVAQSLAVFEQFGYIKRYCSQEKIMQWNSEKKPTEDRWIEIFKHMNDNQVPFNQFSKIIEFVLCFSGTSAPVERIFAKIDKIWRKERSSLSISTLKSMLIVKNNMEYECDEFYKFLKTRPDLLKKISSQEKYDFKQPTTNTSPSAMSITFESDEE